MPSGLPLLTFATYIVKMTSKIMTNIDVTALIKHEKVWHSANRISEVINSIMRISSAGISKLYKNVNTDLEWVLFTTLCKVVNRARNISRASGVKMMMIEDSCVALPGETFQVYPMSVPSQSVKTPCSLA